MNINRPGIITTGLYTKHEEFRDWAYAVLERGNTLLSSNYLRYRTYTPQVYQNKSYCEIIQFTEDVGRSCFMVQFISVKNKLRQLRKSDGPIYPDRAWLWWTHIDNERDKPMFEYDFELAKQTIAEDKKRRAEALASMQPA